MKRRKFVILILIKEKILQFKKNFRFLVHFYVFFLILVIIAFILSQQTLIITNPPSFNLIFQPILLIMIGIIYPFFPLYFLNELLERYNIEMTEKSKNHYFVFGVYCYLVYCIIVFFLFLRYSGFIIPTVIETGEVNPIVFWGFAFFTPLVFILLLYYYSLRKKYKRIPVDAFPISQKDKTDQSVKNACYPPRIKTDSTRYSLIIFSLLSLLGVVVLAIIMIITLNDVYFNDPWFRSWTMFGLIIIMLPLLLAFGGSVAVDTKNKIMVFTFFSHFYIVSLK